MQAMATRQTWAVLLVVLVFSTGSQAAEDLTLELTPMQGDYVLYEPVYLRVTLRNSGSAPVDVTEEMSLETQMSTFYIAGSDDTWQPVNVGFVGEPRGPRVRLEPGGTHVGSQLLLYSPADSAHLFPEPGTWKVRAVLHRFGMAPDVDSNVADIKVGSPTGADAEAAAVFSTAPVVRLVMNLGEDPAAVRDLQQIIEEHPDSRFADYARFYLARRETQPYFSRQPDPAAGIAYLEALLAGPPHAPQLEALATAMLGKLYEASGQAALAAGSYERVIREDPHGASTRAAKQGLQRLARQVAPPARPEHSAPLAARAPTPGGGAAGSAAPTPLRRSAEAARGARPRSRWTTLAIVIAVLFVGGIALYRRMKP
jgi:hypothetical protein